MRLCSGYVLMNQTNNHGRSGPWLGIYVIARIMFTEDPNCFMFSIVLLSKHAIWLVINTEYLNGLGREFKGSVRILQD